MLKVINSQGALFWYNLIDRNISPFYHFFFKTQKYILMSEMVCRPGPILENHYNKHLSWPKIVFVTCIYLIWFVTFVSYRSLFLKIAKLYALKETKLQESDQNQYKKTVSTLE